MASVFISYTHEDEDLKNKFLQHLAPLKRRGLISVWHDRMLVAGEHLDQSVQNELGAADVVVLLISAAFINSEYCYEEEMIKAFQRRARGDARVVALILRPCQWLDVPVEGGRLGDFLAAPTDGKAVTRWSDPEEAFSVAASMIGDVLRSLNGRASTAPPASGPGLGSQPANPAVDQSASKNGERGQPQHSESVTEPASQKPVSANLPADEIAEPPMTTGHLGQSLKIAVLSDLHVFVGSASSGSAPSFIGTADALDAPTRHPLAALKELISNAGLRADLLICPGDMTNQAEPTALNVAWGHLQTLAQWLGAAPPLATNGNHDVDSRYQHNAYDAKGAMQSLLPRFPGLDEQQCDHYWARNYVIVNTPDYRIVLLNSSAYHGVGRESQDKEYDHGRVSSRTLDALEGALKASRPTLNILVCHHHPLAFNPLDEADYSDMEGGERLIEMLASGRFGRWLVIHGHKHFPRITYGTGAVTPPVIFSAGSFSAMLHPKVAQHARNQFYILEVRLDALEAHGLDIAGTVRAWDWISLKGWQEAGQESGIPKLAGFGWQEAPASIAGQIAGLLPNSGSVLGWEEVRNALPRIDYLLPQSLAKVLEILGEHHGVVATQMGGDVFEVGRP
jgi:hypothetical protein